MESIYPKILRSASELIIKFQPFQETEKVGDLDLIVDIDSNTDEVVGVEIVNLEEQVGGGTLKLESYETLFNGEKWGITYEAEYDVAYVGFIHKPAVSLKTKQAKGSVFLDPKRNVVGIGIEI